MLPSDKHTDEQHTGDWFLTDRGCLAVTQFKLRSNNRLHARAEAFAAEMQAAFPSIRAIYLRGSALESSRNELIKDVDIIAVLDREERERNLEIYEKAADLWPVVEGQPRCDFGVMAVDSLLREPTSTVIQIILAFRSVVLAGVPVWKEMPQLKVDTALAARLQASHRKGVQRFLEKTNTTPEKYSMSFLVSWMQKKALRLGGILAMGVSQRFSRHPLRCAVLIAESYPELGESAGMIAHHYIVGQADEVAWRLAQWLFDSLSNYADRMADTQVSALSGEPNKRYSQ